MLSTTSASFSLRAKPAGASHGKIERPSLVGTGDQAIPVPTQSSLMDLLVGFAQGLSDVQVNCQDAVLFMCIEVTDKTSPPRDCARMPPCQ